MNFSTASAVQVDGADERLEDVAQQGDPLPASGCGFPLPQQNDLPQVQLEGELGQLLGPHEG
jgi:hypothetical protein